MDPRRSLIAGITWLVVGLAASFAVAASMWAGGVAREIVVQQHVRRIALETDQFASDVGQAVNARLSAIRAAESSAPAELHAPAEIFKHVKAAYPDLGWIAAADISGMLVGDEGGGNVSSRPWFSQGRNHPWIGFIEGSSAHGNAPLLGDLSAPLRDAAGRTIGVIAAHLTWRWASGNVQRLSKTLDSRGSAQTFGTE